MTTSTSPGRAPPRPGTRALRPSAVTAIVTAGAAFVSPPTTGNARLVQSGVELEHVVELGLRRKGERDEQRLGPCAHRGEIREVDGRRLVAEVAPGGPLEPEVSPLEEQVLRDDEIVAEQRRVVADPRDEAALRELPQEPELTCF